MLQAATRRAEEFVQQGYKHLARFELLPFRDSNDKGGEANDCVAVLTGRIRELWKDDCTFPASRTLVVPPHERFTQVTCDVVVNATLAHSPAPVRLSAKGLQATRSVLDGEMLLSERPLVLCPSDANEPSSCDHCGQDPPSEEAGAQVSAAWVACCTSAEAVGDWCSVKYCSEQCRANAWKQYHRWECRRSQQLRRCVELAEQLHYWDVNAVRIALRLLCMWRSSADRVSLWQTFASLTRQRPTLWQRQVATHQLVTAQPVHQVDESLAWKCFSAAVEALELDAQKDFSWIEFDYLCRKLPEFVHALPTSHGRFGVFEVAPWFEHSCVPNAVMEFDGLRLQATAMQPLVAGEEVLTISLLDEGHTLTERREALKTAFGFQCKCNRCMAEQQLYDVYEAVKGVVVQHLPPPEEVIECVRKAKALYFGIAMIVRTCSWCTASTQNLLKCTGCTAKHGPKTCAYYCSKACQMAHRKMHRPFCSRATLQSTGIARYCETCETETQLACGDCRTPYCSQHCYNIDFGKHSKYCATHGSRLEEALNWLSTQTMRYDPMLSEYLVVLRPNAPAPMLSPNVFRPSEDLRPFFAPDTESNRSAQEMAAIPQVQQPELEPVPKEEREKKDATCWAICFSDIPWLYARYIAQ